MIRSLARWVTAGALVVGFVVLCVLSVLQVLDRSAPSLEDAPMDTGATVARTFFTLDHRTLDEDVDSMLDLATGELEEQYRAQSQELRDSVADQELVLTATVPESGSALEYLTEDEAWVLVAVDVHTEGAGDVSQDSRYRTRVVLELVDDRWLASRLEQVG